MYLLFGNSITKKKEKQEKIKGEVEVLKKQQKVAVEEISKDYDTRKSAAMDAIDAQIVNLNAQIKTLEKSKLDKEDMFDEEKKVAIDKCINDYSAKIISKQNKVRKLGHYIEAENKNIQDILSADTNNTALTAQAGSIAPKKILNEAIVKEKVEKKATKSSK